MNDLDLRTALHRDADLVGEPNPDLLGQLAVRRDKQRRQRAGMLAAALGVVVIAAGIPVGSSLLTQSDPGPAVEITGPAPTVTPEPSPIVDPSRSVVEPPPLPEVTIPSVTQQARVVSPDELLYFHAPSGNIACEMAQDHATCQIMERNFERPTKPADCEWDYGETFGVEGEARGELLCVSDTVFGAPDAFELGYGERIGNGLVTCVSATSGMTCSTSSGSHGFALSRAGYRLY